ncbi:MAG: hypothetical protein KI785_06280 [Devosiaceae bacterium]|nr:hypothetical protein [Devosiaceae bacterium MH13]
MPVYGWVAFAILATGLGILLFAGDGPTFAGRPAEQIAALTASLALLVFLGGGVFRRGVSVSGLAGQALVWIAALVALLIGYGLWQRFMA